MAATLPIGEFLVRKELISPRALAQVIKEQPAKRQRLISMLILRAELEIDDGATVLSEQTGYCAAFERHLERRDLAVAKLLPGALCGQHAVIAFGKTAGGRLIVAARDPSPALAAELERASQLSIELAVVPAILVERLVRATFNITVELAASLPTSHANMPRARSVSALYADTQPPKPVGDVAAPVIGRAPSNKIIIPERRSGPIASASDLDSAPILLDRPKRPTEAPPAAPDPAAPPLRTESEKTQPRPALARAPASVPPRPTPVAPSPNRPPTEPPAPPAMRPPTQPPPLPKVRPSAPALPRAVSQGEEVTRPSSPIDPEARAEAARHQTPTAPAPNASVPVDARPPDRRQQITRPAPNVPIPDEARPPPPGSVAAEPPLPRADSESFGDLLDDPAPTPPPLPDVPAIAPRASAPALPPPPPRAPIRPPAETTQVGTPPMRPPTEPTAMAAPPRPPAAPGTGSIEAVCKDIERAISRATADRVLITFAGSRFKSALLLMVAEGVARGARGQGPRLQAVQTIVLPIEAPSIIQLAHDTRALTRESPASPTQNRLAELLGTTTPLALPVIVDDAVVAVLAVGDPAEPVADPDLEKVVIAFATAYKRLYKAK